MSGPARHLNRLDRDRAPFPLPRFPIALARRFFQLTTAVTADVHEQEQTGLRHPEFGVIVRVHDTPGLDQNSLAEWMALDRTTLARWCSGSSSRDSSNAPSTARIAARVC